MPHNCIFTWPPNHMSSEQYVNQIWLQFCHLIHFADIAWGDSNEVYHGIKHTNFDIHFYSKFQIFTVYLNILYC